MLAPLEAAIVQGIPLPGQLAALREAAGTLTGDKVWAGHQGHQAAATFAEMEAAAGEGPRDTDPRSFVFLLQQVLSNTAIRPPQGGHPRIAILGLLEARLHPADLMILGGLNEGPWPALRSPDPCLSTKLSLKRGLPPIQRR